MNTYENPAEDGKQSVGDFIIGALHETHSNWTKDGFGLRGQQALQVQHQATPQPINFGIDNSKTVFGTPVETPPPPP